MEHGVLTGRIGSRRHRRKVRALALALGLALAGVLFGGVLPSAASTPGEPVGKPAGVPAGSGARPAPAGDGEAGLAELTLEEALRRALEHSPRVQRAASAIRQSEAREDEAGSVRRPRVDLVTGLERARDAGVGAFQERNQARIALSYRQIIGDTEDTRLAEEDARLRTDMARAQRQKETVEALAGVVDAYVGVLEAESGLHLSEVMVRYAEEAERVMRERYEQDAATEIEVLSAETAAERARQGVQVASASLRLAYEALYRAMGTPAPSRFPKLQPADDLARAVSAGGVLEAIVSGEGPDHPDVVAARRALDAARVALRQVQRADRPRLELSGAYTRLRSGEHVAFTLDDAKTLGVTASYDHPLGRDRNAGEPVPEDAWRLGLQLSWPLTDAGAGAAREAQVEAQVAQAELQLEELTAALSLRLASQYEKVAQAWQDVVLGDADRAEAERAYDVVRRQFEAGAATRLDVWRAEGNVIEHRTEGVRARAKAVRAAVALAAAAGVDADGLTEMFAF